MRQVRSGVSRGTVNYSIEELEKRNIADYISIITNDVKMAKDNFLLPFLEIIQYTVIFTSFSVSMIYFDIIVTMRVIMAIAIMFLAPSLLGQKLEKRQNIFSSKLADFTNSLKDILSGFEIIKSHSMKRYVVQRFDKENSETIHSKYDVDELPTLNEGLSSFLAPTARIVVLSLSAYFIITERVTIGILLGMVQASNSSVNPPVMTFTNASKIESIQPTIEKLHSISEQASKNLHKEHRALLNRYILAENLSFSYDT